MWATLCHTKDTPSSRRVFRFPQRTRTDMAAVRSVLLSDVQNVLSLTRRRHGYLLTSTTGQRSKQVRRLSVDHVILC
jgi:hypothetical protein